MSQPPTSARAPARNSHCGFCGAKWPDPRARFPRVCERCANKSDQSPLPVALAIVPVIVGDEDDRPTGLVLIRRGPNVDTPGKLAVPGGFMEVDETWQQAAARELREETSIRTRPEEITLFHIVSVHTSPTSSFLLTFGLAHAQRQSNLPKFTPSGEATERIVVTQVPEGGEMAYEKHEEAVRLWFSKFGPADVVKTDKEETKAPTGGTKTQEEPTNNDTT